MTDDQDRKPTRPAGPMTMPAALVWVAFLALCAYGLYLGTGGR